MFLWKAMTLIALCKSVHLSPTQTADNKSSETVSLCEGDWIQHGTKCYKFVKRRVFRVEASASCITMGGHLASIHSKEETDFINDLLKTQNFPMKYLTPYRWIGLRDNNSMHEFVWEDGSQFQYTNWDQLEPYGPVTCVAIYFPDYLKVGKWRLVQCFLKLPYLCQRKIPTTALTRKEEADKSITTVLDAYNKKDDNPVYLFPNQTAENNSVEGLSLCEENWKQYGQLCYKLEKRGLSWEKSAASCVTMGGYLASIHSKEQSDFVNGLISTHINLWDNPGSYRWIGLRENGSKYNFEWQDGSQFDFTNWFSNEPNNRGPILCAAVFFPDGDSNGKWKVVLCHILLPYVCQKQIPTTEIASTEKFGASVQTSVIPKKQNDYEPGLHNYLSLFKEQFDLVRTTTYTSNEEDSSLGSISVTSFIATIVVVITLLVLMGGIIYHRQTWLKEKRMRLHRVFFRSTLTDTD